MLHCIMIYNHVKKNKVCFLRCLEGAAGLIVTLSTVKSYAHKMWSVTFAVKFHLSFENFDVISMVSMRVLSPFSKMDIFGTSTSVHFRQTSILFLEGELPYKSDRDAHRLNLGCKLQMLVSLRVFGMESHCICPSL